MLTLLLLSRLSKARPSRLPPPASRPPLRVASSPERRCSAPSILRSRQEMTAGAEALVIAGVDGADATSVGGVPARVDAADEIAGRPGAICHRPNTPRRRTP